MYCFFWDILGIYGKSVFTDTFRFSEYFTKRQLRSILDK